MKGAPSVERRGSTRMAASSLAPRRSHPDAGFTLIELLVVCGIMVVVTGIMLASNKKYGGNVTLQNFAYDLALSVRQAQVYGISVQRFGSGESASFTSGYGVHFDTSTPAAATTYIIFADAVSANGLYDQGEFVRTMSINRGYKILRLCAPAGTDPACTGGSVVSRLDILFVRPEPDALIAVPPAQCFKAASPACQSNARIVLKSPQGGTMSVSVQANGQIAVDQKSVIAP